MFYNTYNTMYSNFGNRQWIGSRINVEAAIMIALQRIPGQVMKVEFDYENGFLVYEIVIRNPSGVYEVHVNAASGQIIKVEIEND